MKLKLAVQEYLRDIEIKKYTPKTIRSYTVNLNVLLSFLETQNVYETEELTPLLMKEFALFMSKKGRKGTYINSLLKTSKSFITYCYNEGYGGFNTRYKFSWVKQEKPVIRAFKPKDVKAMLSDCVGVEFLPVRDRCVLTTLFETGIRCWELCCIKNEDIHPDFIIINGKNHKQRVVPITPVLAKAMMKYDVVKENYFPFKKNEYYFVSFHGNQLTNSAVEHIIKRHGEGIKDMRVGPHTCRHFFAQQQLKMGTDIYTISRLLGHESIAITQTYLDSLRDEDVIAQAKNRSVLGNL